MKLDMHIEYAQHSATQKTPHLTSASTQNQSSVESYDFGALLEQNIRTPSHIKDTKDNSPGTPDPQEPVEPSSPESLTPAANTSAKNGKTQESEQPERQQVQHTEKDHAPENAKRPGSDDAEKAPDTTAPAKGEAKAETPVNAEAAATDAAQSEIEIVPLDQAGQDKDAECTPEDTAEKAVAPARTERTANAANQTVQNAPDVKITAADAPENTGEADATNQKTESTHEQSKAPNTKVEAVHPTELAQKTVENPGTYPPQAPKAPAANANETPESGRNEKSDMNRPDAGTQETLSAAKNRPETLSTTTESQAQVSKSLDRNHEIPQSAPKQTEPPEPTSSSAAPRKVDLPKPEPAPRNRVDKSADKKPEADGLSVPRNSVAQILPRRAIHTTAKTQFDVRSQPAAGPRRPTDVEPTVPLAADRAQGQAAADAVRDGAKPRLLNQTQFIDAILRQSKFLTRPDGSTELRINLQPPELGAVTVRLTLHNDQLTARLHVDTVVAREIVEDLMNKVKESLAGDGLDLERFDVGLRDERNQQTERDTENQSAPSRDGAKPEAVAKTSIASAASPKLDPALYDTVGMMDFIA